MDINRLKNYSTIFLITIISTFLSFSVLGMFLQEPLYESYCNNSYFYKSYPAVLNENCSDYNEPTSEEFENCSRISGEIMYEYENGCVSGFRCETCQNEYYQALKDYKLINFSITSPIGILLIIISLNYPKNKKIKGWIYSSILFSGILILIISTIDYYSEMDRILRPIVLLAELILMVLVARKNL